MPGREQQQEQTSSAVALIRPQPSRRRRACGQSRRPADQPPPLYAWDIFHPDRDEGGVTDDPGLAIRYVNEALADAGPGTCARVRRVRPRMSGRGPYLELGTEAEAHVDEATGAVVWT